MRYGDELDHKLRTCQKEIMALANTLDHLKMRNKNYRDKIRNEHWKKFNNNNSNTNKRWTII